MFDATYTVRLLGPADAALLKDADPEVFDHPVNERWSTALLNDPHHHLAVALVGGRVVGSATAVRHLHPDRPPQLFILELAVSHPHRQRGIAKAMLQALLGHGRRLGCAQARVSAEQANLAARALYASAGGKLQSDSLVEFSFDLE
jgi:ribosomal protein S18 acetylase RimI-like enzyme